MGVWIILLLWGGWGVYAYFLIRKLLEKDLKYLFEPKVNLLNRNNSGARYDPIELNKLEVYFGAIFLLPIRAILGLTLTIISLGIAKVICLIFGVTELNYLEPKSQLYRDCTYWSKLIFSKIIFFIWGFYTMPVKEFDIYDFWADYKPIQDVSNAPLIISNHTSYFDIWLYLLIKESPGFLSKFSVKSVPIIGFYAKMHQTIFFNRSDPEQKKKSLKLIKERVELAKEGKINPILIFPEGTTTNGRGMMKFKKGAFEMEKPIKVFSLYYESRFIPCLNLLRGIHSVLIVYSLFINKVSFFKFKQPIDPLWILKKHGRKPGMEGNWKIVAKEIKDLMCFAFGFVNDDMSFKEKCRFDCDVQGISKKELNKRG